MIHLNEYIINEREVDAEYQAEMNKKKSEGVQFEAETVTIDGKDYFKIPECVKQSQNIEEDYYPVDIKSLGEAVKKAVDMSKSVVDKINTLSIDFEIDTKNIDNSTIDIEHEKPNANEPESLGLGVLLTTAMGRIFETCLAKSINSTSGKLKFHQGKEASDEADIECSEKKWSIELKTKQKPSSSFKLPEATGNKSHANSTSGQKSKDDFYIVINYNFNKATEENGYKASIGNFAAWFGFLYQNNWIGTGKNGNSSSLKPYAQKHFIKVV